MPMVCTGGSLHKGHGAWVSSPWRLCDVPDRPRSREGAGGHLNDLNTLRWPGHTTCCRAALTIFTSPASFVILDECRAAKQLVSPALGGDLSPDLVMVKAALDCLYRG
jgi:hypothetical protein